MAGELGQLKSGEWDQLQQYADRLEEAWKQVGQGQPGPDLKQFLPPAGAPLRLVVLHELIKTEMEIRWRQGLPTSLEHYLEKFSELGGAKDLPAALVYEEFRVRQQYGDRPPMAAYKIRFPAQFDELEKLHNNNPSPTAAVPTPPLVQPGHADTQIGAAPQQRTVASGGTVLPGGYKLLKRIGSGTFGEVWRAEAPGGVPCAVKIVIRPVDAEEAQRELHALELIKQLQHPFLMQTHRFETFEDRLYIVMELADGSLRDRLKQRRKENKGGIPVPELIRYFRESAEALDFLHSEKVLHRDIKPENILILKGHAKVADFGLARGQGSGASMFSATGCGTPAYMAPEVWRGKVSHHTDQYSLAIAYGELRLDRRLFTGGDFMQVMMSHLEKTPDLSPLGEAEQKVLLQAMAKEPTQRFATCLAFTEALEEALAPELGKSGAYSIRKPTSSAQDLRVPAETAELGTVGRANLPSRPGSSGDRTEREGWRPGAGERRPWWRSMLLLLSIFVPLAWVAWNFLPRLHTNAQTGPFQFRDLPGVTLRANEKQSLQLQINRGGVKDPIELSFPNQPPGLVVTTDHPSVGSDIQTVTLLLEAKDDIEPGIREITVRGDSGDLNDSKTFPVTVLPLRTLPPNCERASGTGIVGDSEGNKFYERIILTREQLQIAFLAIVKKRPSDPASFYMMENKVSNREFAEAFKDTAFQTLLSEQAKRVSGSVKGEWKDLGAEASSKPLGSKDGKLPVMRVTVVEAHCFAQWLGGLLPTTLEWDKAAGRFEPDRGRGPFKGTEKQLSAGEVAVGRSTLGPLPVGTAAKDISYFQCRDMAGNGREWTRNLAGSTPRVVPLAVQPQLDDRVILRGRRYQEDKPLLFAEIDIEVSGGVYDVEDYLQAQPDIGFRVVLEPK